MLWNQIQVYWVTRFTKVKPIRKPPNRNYWRAFTASLNPADDKMPIREVLVAALSLKSCQVTKACRAWNVNYENWFSWKIFYIIELIELLKWFNYFWQKLSVSYTLIILSSESSSISLISFSFNCNIEANFFQFSATFVAIISISSPLTSSVTISKM